MRKKFSGIVAALVTPFTKEGKVNYVELGRLVRYLIEKGIDGFYVGGSTAEAFLLTQDERKNILETVLKENNNEKFVIAHVGHISTDMAADLASHAKYAGADAVSAISPFYYKFTVEEIKSYYFDIMDACDLPLFIYNYPANTGFNLTNDLLDEFCKKQNIAGVKFTCSDFFQLERMKTAHPELVLWNGYDEMLLSGLASGADGGIGSTYNCICPLIRGIYDNFVKGDISLAQEYQKRTNDIISVFIRNGVIASIKTILNFEGFNFNGCRKPFLPVTQDGVKELKEIYKKYIN